MIAHKGFGTIAVISAVAGLVIIGSLLYFNMQPEGEIMKAKGEQMITEGEGMVKKGEDMKKEGEDMKKKAEDMGQGQSTSTSEESTLDTVSAGTYTGKRIGGRDSAPLLEFNEKDYETAQANGDLIFLDFFANWCPICADEFPKVVEGFNELDAEHVVGFRVNYKDSDTESAEEDAAREYGVSYQHTKILVRNGERILKTLDSWDKDTLINTINENL